MSFARSLLGFQDANSSEFTPEGCHNVIDLMPDQQGNLPKGGTMRLGAYPCQIKKNSILDAAYGTPVIQERHRHRYEFNNQYREQLETAGLMITGIKPRQSPGGGNRTAGKFVLCRRTVSSGV